MAKAVKLFVKTKWNIEPYGSMSEAWVHGGRPPEDRIERIMSKDDVEILKTATQFAEEKGLELEVHDLATPRGWISALINRVKTTPTIIINNQRIEAIKSKDDLLQALKERHTD